MKQIVTSAEFQELKDEVYAGLTSDIEAGSPNHIDDHIAISSRLNYFPFSTQGSMTKTGDNQWRFSQGGETYDVPDSIIDEQVSMLADYPEYTQGLFLVIDGGGIDLPASDRPVGSKITMYQGGVAGYEGYATGADLDTAFDELRTAGNEIEKLDAITKSMFNIYSFIPNQSGSWELAGWSPTPEYPLGKISAELYFEEQGRGSASFSSFSGPEDLQSFNTYDYDRIELSEWKASPDFVLDKMNGLDARADALESDNSTLNATVSTLESDIGALTTVSSTLEGKVSTLESDNSTLNSTVSTLEGNVATLTSDKEALEGQVSTLESTIGDLTTRLEALEAPGGEV